MWVTAFGLWSSSGWFDMLALTKFLPMGGGLYLGWALGANNAANVFGTAVGTHIIGFRRAAFVCGVMVILGAVLQGGEGIKTMSGITDQTVSTAILVSVAAALTSTLMTWFGIPISTSQAVVGAILGIGLATRDTDFSSLGKVVICWVGTPLGSMLFAIFLYKVLAVILRRLPMGLLTRDKLLWAGLYIVGMYGSYALGANNVANSTGMFSGLVEGLNDRHLAAIGGVSIAVGVLTYGKRVMLSVGRSIMRLDAFTAFVAVLSMSATVHIFAVVGVPVSTSQGIVGAIFGIGILRGGHVLHLRALWNIVLGWVLTPAIALVLSAAGYAIFL